jgi:diaminohydroxyphosphoribosylaminopyrimidine deaminase/5-amino-6-(5-phosphoribosylamino)uracil reductase
MTRRALEIAPVGIGLVSPNPLVGCVVVSAVGEVVGEGAYVYDNVVHAEQIALNQAGEWAKGGTAYVSLEPHDHQGRTPPCTTALINAGIKRVVCPIEDPNPRVSGRGFARLREAGVEVVTGIASDEATKLNEKFICWHTKQRPFVHLKLAMSLDGRISLGRSISTMLSGETALKRVHELRHEYDAILVGGNTAAVDNPSLTDRSGKPRRRKLVRVVLDNRLRISLESELVKTATETPTVVVTNSTDENKIAQLRNGGVDLIAQDARDLNSVLDALKTRSLQSVIVEGGSKIAGAFVDACLVDKFTFIYSPLIVGGNDAPVAVGGDGTGVLDNAIRLTDVTTQKLGDDIEITGYPTKQ